MRNFIMFFDEKEGTTALVSLLGRFSEVSVVQLEGNGSLEPFDRHACGPMKLRDLERCLNLVFSPGPRHMGELNRIYLKTGNRPLAAIDSRASVGFKMRYRAPWPDRRRLSSLKGVVRRVVKAFIAYRQILFTRMITRVLQRHRVAVLIAVRQDLLKWALSKYHGDGTGNPGHLQFQLARGAIRHEDIGRIHVDCTALGKIIDQCENIHATKRRLQNRLERLGIDVYPVLYEDFLNDRASSIEQILCFLDVDVPRDEIDAIAVQKERFIKVHSDDIRDFVENYDEVIEKFGKRFSGWR